MKKISMSINRHSNCILILISLLFILLIFQWKFTEISIISIVQNHSLSNIIHPDESLRYRRQSCSCTRPLIKSNSNLLIIDERSTSLCSHYSTLRGAHQRIISISMYGPRENSLFALNKSITFLYQLIDDVKTIYPGWILRVYHDQSIKDNVICPIECAYDYVDFCNTTALGNLESVSGYIPGKIWRFLPVGDELVDIMTSRDLDSPLSQRELAAVKEWIASGKAWHTMRDHPMHFTSMLGGMWGFRPALNRKFANDVLRKILNHSLIVHYGGRGDQRFLNENVWLHIQDDVIAHDSYLCETSYGNNSRPWPTRRPRPSVDRVCFVGCVRPCCHPSKSDFKECPLACRPKNHTDWTTC